MSDENSLQKVNHEVIEQTNQEWSAWSALGILSLLSMPLCLIGAFLYHDNQLLFTIFSGATVCLLLLLVVSFKKGTAAADQSLSIVRNCPREMYDLNVLIEIESEGPDSYFGLLQSQTDSFWIQFSIPPKKQTFLQNLPSKEKIPVTVQKSNDQKGAILVSLDATELTAWRTNRRDNPPELIRMD